MSDFRLDFIGIGAAKAATTWLADVLRQHPQIFMPREKELNYFQDYWFYTHEQVPNKNVNKPLSWYHAYFARAEPSQIKGEISPSYLLRDECAAKIHAYNPSIKILALLRKPLEQVRSMYLYFRQKGRMHYSDYATALRECPNLLSGALYYDHLKRYFDLFPRQNIKVLLHDDLVADSIAFLNNVYDFLGVEPHYPPLARGRSNVTGEPRFYRLNHAINRARVFLNKHGLQGVSRVLRYTGIIPLAEIIRDRLNVRKLPAKPRLDPAREAEMRAYFNEDISKLEKLLDVDLSGWR